MPQTVPFQAIQFSIRMQFNCKKTFLFQAIQFSQAVLIQTIQLYINMQLVLFDP